MNSPNAADVPEIAESGGLSVAELRKAFLWHLRYSLVTSELKQTPKERYLSFSFALRDQLVERWMDTQDAYYLAQTRRVYYLSMEFLIGRLLGNNAINLQMDAVCAEALREGPTSWEAMKELEDDPGLGNGGLGRLAACFLDSAATLGLPCSGYGLRYAYGLFQQKIVNGAQMEEPDIWRRNGYPWEIKRPGYSVKVGYGGESVQIEINSKRVWRWFPGEHVSGVPYDIPVVGYGARTVNNLRLWSAHADNEFDFQTFNQGSYTEAVESKIHAENLTKTLYPNDNIEQGKELRLRQQYFFVACTLHDILRRHSREARDWFLLPEKVFIQLNDTHPTLVIPELMRILVDEKDIEWDAAWAITRACTGYTNHTMLPEALEKWDMPLFNRLLPRHMQIIYEINGRFLRTVSSSFPGDHARLQRMSIIEEGGMQRVRMAHLAMVGSKAINGVAAIHSRLLKETLFKDFAELWPEKFQNKTNGITQRRWLLMANPALAELITRRIGSGWITDLPQLRQLEAYLDDGLPEEMAVVKQRNKIALAQLIASTQSIKVDPSSIFDVQVKRMHEYKRQLLLVLYIIIMSRRLLQKPDLDIHPRTFIFSGKAAPGYALAKLIIKLIHGVAKVVNNSHLLNQKLCVVFMPDYRVSLAEKIIPAANVSEQISLAGTEASGTGNMKLMLNGAITLGTEDGATVEIHEEVGDDNIVIFGQNAAEAMANRATYSSWDIYHADSEIREALDCIKQNMFCPLAPGDFDPILRSLLDFGDHYMLLADLRSYIAAQERVDALYRDKTRWNRMSAINVARAGHFSSDQTIRKYAEEIWDLQPFDVQKFLAAEKNRKQRSGG